MKRLSIRLASFVCISGIGISSLLPGAVRGQERIKPSLSIAGLDGYVTAVAFSPDSKSLAAGSVDIRVFDATSGKPVRDFSRELAGVNDVYFAPDGRQLISASGGGALESWDLRKDQERKSILTSASGSITTALSPDGKLVALNYSERLTLAGDSLVLWDLAAGRERTVLERKTDARAWAFSPDGKTLVAGYPKGRLKFWDVPSGKLTRNVVAWPDVEIGGVAYSPDGRSLAIEPYDGRGGGIWNIATGREDGAIGGDDDLDDLAYSPDGRYLAAIRRNRIVLWDAATRKEKHVLTGGSLRGLACFAFSGDGEKVAAGTTYTLQPLKDARVYVWNLADLE